MKCLQRCSLHFMPSDVISCTLTPKISSHVCSKSVGNLKLAMTNVLSTTIVHLYMEQEFAQNIEPGTPIGLKTHSSLTLFTSRTRRN